MLINKYYDLLNLVYQECKYRNLAVAHLFLFGTQGLIGAIALVVFLLWLCGR